MDGQKAPLRLVIIGGVAAGASAAARARRLCESAQITIIERGQDISFANCGMPYYVGGEITDRAKLALHTPQSLGTLLNAQIFTQTEAIEINRERKIVIVKDLKTNIDREIPYDKLILSPGARPMKPPIPGINDSRIFVLRNLQDMDKIKGALANVQKVLVIGAGFIGLEMVEMLHKLRKEVTLVELMNQVLPQMDSEMAKAMEVELANKGIHLILGDGIAEFSPEPQQISAKLKSGKTIVAEAIVLSIGIQCESELAAKAGLSLGIRNSIKVNEFQQTSDPDIYAAGDVAETYDPILGKRTMVPLGGPANRQGRVAADHIFLGNGAKPYPGTIGTAIVRVFDVVGGVTGYTEKRLKQENIPYRQTIVTGSQHASYYPGAVPLVVKLIWAPDTGKILGGQVVGCDGVDKRLDVLATAISGKMTIEDLVHLELSYAPPFGSARDVLNIAAFAATNIQNGLVELVDDFSADTQIVDVRPALMSKANPIPGATNIPLEQLRARVDELRKEKPITAVCALGKSSYFAARFLKQLGYQVKSFAGGWNLRSQKPNPTLPNASCKQTCSTGEKTMSAETSASITKTPASGASLPPLQLDTCGLSCPGPVMKIKEALAQLQEGQELVVMASDPGFSRDFTAYCQTMGLEFLGMEQSKGIITAKARKGVAKPSSHSAAKALDGATLVVFSNDMDKVLASLVIANGAAAMGGKVTMFFTFWGLTALRKEGKTPKISGKGFMDKMFGWMLPKGPKGLQLSQMHMAGMGTAMMKWRMVKKNLPNVPGLLAEAQKAGVRIIACSMSMEAMGIRREELIDGIEVGGVADFIAASRETATSLFI